MDGGHDSSVDGAVMAILIGSQFPSDPCQKTCANHALACWRGCTFATESNGKLTAPPYVNYGYYINSTTFADHKSFAFFDCNAGLPNPIHDVGGDYIVDTQVGGEVCCCH